MEKSILNRIIICSTAILLVISFGVIILFFQPSKIINNLDHVDLGVIQKIYGVGFVSKTEVIKEIEKQFKGIKKESDITLLKDSIIHIIDKMTESNIPQNKIVIELGNKATKDDLEKYNKQLLSSANEIEKEKNKLIRNVVIINLIGRYTVILCCIVAFALIIRAFAHSRIKDDIFE